MRRSWAAVAVVAGLLLGCGADAPASGYVRDKNFEPAHWEGGYRHENRYGYKCGIDYHGEYTCGMRSYTEDVYEDEHQWINDKFQLFLEDCHNNEDGKQKCTRGWRTVTSGEYDRYRVGSHYPNAQ